MRVFICGSLYEEHFPEPEKREAIAKAAQEVGRELTGRGAVLIVGTDAEQSVDWYVVKGALGEAKRIGAKLHIYVHYLRSLDNVPFSELSNDKNVKIIFHEVDSDVWHVAHMKAVENCDCVLLMAGQKGTLVAGLTSMLHGIPFVPIASFDGGARDVWRIAIHDPTRYFFGALEQDELDKLGGPWEDAESPGMVVGYLLRLVAWERKTIRLNLGTQIVLIIGLFTGICAYIFSLYRGVSEVADLGWLWLLVGSIATGLTGASIAVLTGRDKLATSSLGQTIVRMVTGIGAGFLVFLLLPSLQLLSNGTVSVELAGSEFLRFWILAGAVAAYGGLCTNKIVDRFIGHIGSQLASTSEHSS